jgi:hypothetical protein
MNLDVLPESPSCMMVLEYAIIYFLYCRFLTAAARQPPPRNILILRQRCAAVTDTLGRQNVARGPNHVE